MARFHKTEIKSSVGICFDRLYKRQSTSPADRPTIFVKRELCVFSRERLSQPAHILQRSYVSPDDPSS